MVSKDYIGSDDFELYHYGLFILLSELSLLLFCILAGLLLKIVTESIIFYFSFLVLRRFAGGYHASTELKCQIVTFSSFTLSLVLISLTSSADYILFCIILQFFCGVILIVASPADTPQKQLSPNERKTFKLITAIILMAFLSVSVLALKYSLFLLSTPLTVCVVLETVLVLFGRLLNKRLGEI